MEIKLKSHPITYIMQRHVRIVGPVYFKDQSRRSSTPEGLDEHCIGYINTAIFLMVIGSQFFLRLKPRLPLKLSPSTMNAPPPQLVRSIVHWN